MPYTFSERQWLEQKVNSFLRGEWAPASFAERDPDADPRHSLTRDPNGGAVLEGHDPDLGRLAATWARKGPIAFSTVDAPAWFQALADKIRKQHR